MTTIERQKCQRCKVNLSLDKFKQKRDDAYQKTCLECLDKLKFKCNLCNFKGSQNIILQQHIKKIHDKIIDSKTKDFECNKCNFKCYQNSNLLQHIKSIHDKIKDFECELCDFKCSRNGDLQTHIISIHRKIKKFECELCDYKCSISSHLKRHIKQVHDKINDFECNLCDFKCSQNCNLQTHIKTCNGFRSISGLEMRCIEYLEELGFEEDIDYIFNNTYDKLTKYCKKSLRFDIRFLNHNIMIELDGEQHYKPMRFGGMSLEKATKAFEYQKNKDNIKNNFCKEFNYKMIRISYTDINNMLGILHYELQDILDF